MKRVLLAVWLLLATGSTVLRAQTGGTFAPGGQQLVVLDWETNPNISSLTIVNPAAAAQEWDW